MANAEQGLQLDEDMPFQERFWKVERLAWIVFLAILLAALLGFTGSGGLFARATATSGDGEIAYPRVARWEARDRVEITAPVGERVTVALDREFLRQFQIETITPPPQQSEVSGTGVVLGFPATTGSSGRATIILDIMPTRPSFGTDATITIGGGDAVRLGTVVLP